jgi:ribonuclease HII
MKVRAGVKYIIGIDEAGRGPLAGPVSVGVCLVSAEMTRKSLLAVAAKSGLKKLNDSKKLSAKRREAWLEQMGEMQKTKGGTEKSSRLDFSVTLVSNKIIDERGLSFAIRKATSDSLKNLQKTTKFKPSQCMVLLDGGLRAPAEFIFQKTIIKGDEKEFAISLASIAAKVIRDAHMKKMSKKYPAYGFEIHKGYGTARHIVAIKKEGITPAHRRSFLKNII